MSNFCKQCGKEIPEGRKFCNSSCAAKYNNKHRTRKPWTKEQRKRASCRELKRVSNLRTKGLSVKRDGSPYVSYTCKVCGKQFTRESKRRDFGIHMYDFNFKYCSPECAKQAYDTWRQSTGGYRKGSGRGKAGWYHNIWCDSSWELAFVVFCIDSGYTIKRSSEKRKYTFEGQEHTYHPDFEVNGKLFEIKGYVTEQWKAKACQNPDITTLYRSDIKKYLTYVKERYGKVEKNIVDLYDCRHRH